ncbi:MAG: FG-GAP repeat protein, partial [Acidobacteria bacterium]|nr:FG-GAP repeat protein [Acidobacteriota bacterium]
MSARQNRSGIADSQDVEDGSSEDCNDNGVPDECDLGHLLLAGEVSAEDADASDELGTAVAVSHGVALVAALRDDDAGTSAGAVYAFGRSDGTWSQQDKLTASDGSSLDSFGYSVAMDGALAVIGARRHDLDEDTSDSGSVYVFARDAGNGSWNQVAQLLASDAAGGDNFGYAVDIADSTLVVGARNRDEDGSNSGSVYVYSFDGATWADEQRLEAEDAEGGDRFGESVALDEDGARMVIGVPFSDDDGSASGSAYVFTTGGMSGASQQAKLTAGDATLGDQFGIVVAITGDTVFVGAPEDDTDIGVNGGSVYVFIFDGVEWTESQQLAPSDGGGGDNFG